MIKDRQDNQGIRLTSLVILIFLGLLLSVFFAAGKFSPQRRLLQISFADRINPNTASVASLVRLPGIGRVKAEAIVLYRPEFFSRRQKCEGF